MTGPCPAPAAPDEAAVAWFVRLRDPAADDAARREHGEWLAADPRHLRAWREVEALWSGLDGLAPQRSAPPVRRGPRWRAMALAASIAIACAGAWALAPVGLFADLRSGIGERSRMRLADGSDVELGSSSALSVRYDAAARRVVLHRGEAFFSVVSGDPRPFVVEAADARVTVVGTRFDVKVEDGVRVAVVEGVVTLSGGRAGPVRLVAGTGARFSAGTPSAPSPIDLDEATAWRDGRLVFQDRPLGQVVRDLERHRWGRILVLDDAVAGLPVTGSFQAARGDAALDTIAATLPVRIVRVTDLLTLILRAD
ncbi:iron dicitrate transporter FecR [Allostella sp. ATCC 35155]|nr:iron dicitrate transporter FecR [Stella sp. ATCC 35155]